MNGKEDGFKKFITQYKKDDVIYNKGEEQAFFYIINTGKVHVKLDDSDTILVALAKGDFFGEESLNEGQSASYTVEVVEDSDIIKIPYSALTDMMKKNNAISLKILKKLSREEA